MDTSKQFVVYFYLNLNRKRIFSVVTSDLLYIMQQFPTTDNIYVRSSSKFITLSLNFEQILFINSVPIKVHIKVKKSANEQFH